MAAVIIDILYVLSSINVDISLLLGCALTDHSISVQWSSSC